MPIVDSGKHICENKNCKKEFEWTYFEFLRQKIGQEDLIVQTIPDITLVYEYIIKTDGSKFIKVNCPYCSFDNHFTSNN